MPEVWSPSIPTTFYFILFYFCKLYTLVSLSGNWGRLTWVSLQQPQQQRYPVLQMHAGSFRNPPNSNMDYKDLSRASAYVIIRMPAYTQGGVEHTDSESQHNIFDSEQVSQIVHGAPDGAGV